VLLPLDHPLATKAVVSAADIARDALFRPRWPDATLDEIIDQVAMGELIVTAAASATDRIGSAVVARPVLDAPPTWLVLTWRPDVPAATRDAFVSTGICTSTTTTPSASSAADGGSSLLDELVQLVGDVEVRRGVRAVAEVRRELLVQACDVGRFDRQ
jgi:hypothetical protein